MPRNIFTVVIDRMISAARVKVRDDTDAKTWDIDPATGLGGVAVKQLRPDGTNTMPAGDAAARAVYTTEGNSAAIKTALEIMDDWDDADRCKIQGGNTSDVKVTLDGEKVAINEFKPDGTNTLPAADAPARAHFTRFVPSRPASDLGAGIITFNHGTVAADWNIDSATTVTQSAGYDLWITDIDVAVLSDSTAEVAVQPIPFELYVYDNTDAQYRAILTGGIPDAPHFTFNTPLKIERNHGWYTGIKLGGATSLSIYVCINGYEEA